MSSVDLVASAIEDLRQDIRDLRQENREDHRATTRQMDMVRSEVQGVRDRVERLERTDNVEQAVEAQGARTRGAIRWAALFIVGAVPAALELAAHL